MDGVHLKQKPLGIKSIFQKFTLAFIAVGLIPLLILSYIALETFSRNIERVSVSNFQQLLEFTSKSLDNMLHDYNKITQLMYSYNISGYGNLSCLLKATASRQKNKVDEYQTLHMTTDFVNYILATKSDIETVILIDNSFNTYYSSRGVSPFNVDSFNPKQQLKKINAYAKSFVIQPPHREKYFTNSADWVITFARNYYDWDHSQINDNDNILGSIFIDVDLKVFNDLFSRLSLGEHGEIYVVDDQGCCIYSNRYHLITTKLDWYLQRKAIFAGKDYTGVFRDGAAYYITQRVPRGNWTVVGKVYQKDLSKKVNAIKNFLVLVIVACTGALIPVSLAFSKGFSVPVQKMLQQMKKVEKGDFNVRVEADTQDEMGQLAKGFNNMLHELQDYIARSYVAQLKQKEAELTALKTQIRPHFLYNTLEVIRMSAIDTGDEKVADMIQALAVQLKYIIGYEHDTVTLGQELEIVQNYCGLVRARYEQKIDLVLNVPDELMNLSILKLTLQPIVENAVNHGLKPKEGRGRVMISGVITDSNLEINVFDDGVGMRTETLAEITRLLASETMGKPTQDGWKNVGLKNVHDRLRLHFGEQFGLVIKSQEKIGTVVTIVMPVMKGVTNCRDSNFTG